MLHVKVGPRRRCSRAFNKGRATPTGVSCSGFICSTCDEAKKVAEHGRTTVANACGVWMFEWCLTFLGKNMRWSSWYKSKLWEILSHVPGHSGIGKENAGLRFVLGPLISFPHFPMLPAPELLSLRGNPRSNGTRKTLPRCRFSEFVLPRNKQMLKGVNSWSAISNQIGPSGRLEWKTAMYLTEHQQSNLEWWNQHVGCSF